MEKIENIKRPIKLGEKYLVPCIYREEFEEIEHDEIDLFLEKELPKYQKTIFITPIINHPHNDKENGQNETHYHADFRFIIKGKLNSRRKKINYIFADNIRPQDKIHGKIKYFELPVVNEEFSEITPVELISKSKLKRRCIHKGKCPHRGYDLGQVKPIDGIITCPLHGLKFNDEGKIINK